MSGRNISCGSHFDLVDEQHLAQGAISRRKYVAGAVANAIFHATGKRVPELPITPDKLF